MDPLKNKLFSKASIGSEDQCWNWKAGTSIGGYGRIRVGKVTRFAHRVSFEIHHGEIREGMFVCHSCDNPACINPAHLFLGTPADNMIDRDRKGRQARQRGITNGVAKLTDTDVLSIRSTKGLLQRELAEQYGVSRGHISFIRTGKKWSHI